MYKTSENQVAGHKGPVIDDSGHFYKPLQSGERGAIELKFYTTLSSNTTIPDRIRKFFPEFYGTQLIESADGSGLQSHIVLQDLLSTRVHPSLIDIKIGSRTWYPQASDDYIEKCLKRDKASTSLSLGFLICGLQVYESSESGFWKPERKSLKSFKIEDVRLFLRKFVSSNPLSDSEPDCSFVSTVYGGTDGILAQLLELKAWFEVQTIFQFNSCSVIMIYENEMAKDGISSAVVKLVDFAHVEDGDGVIDHNFLGGLCSLIKFVSEMVYGHVAIE